MALVTNGTPVLGYVQLVNGAIGPTPFTLYVNGAAYTLPAPSNTPGANERLYITNLTVSSNDTQALITIDDGVANARKLMSTYVSATQPPAVEQIPPGVCRLEPGQTPRATGSAVSGGKTVEVVLKGYVSRT